MGGIRFGAGDGGNFRGRASFETVATCGPKP